MIGIAEKDFMIAFGICLAGDPSISPRPAATPHTTDGSVVVFVHYVDNVFLKLTASVEELIMSSTNTLPTVAAPYRSDMPLPPPYDHQIEKRSVSDFVIIAVIVAVMGLGGAVGLCKTGLLQRCCTSCSCRAGRGSTKSQLEDLHLHHRIKGGSWRECPLYDGDGEDEEDVHGYVEEMDRASHGMQTGGYRADSLDTRPHQAMPIGTGHSAKERKDSGGGSTTISIGGGGCGGGSGGGKSKSKSQLMHEAIMKAATGRGGINPSTSSVAYSQLRIDDEDDFL